MMMTTTCSNPKVSLHVNILLCSLIATNVYTLLTCNGKDFCFPVMPFFVTGRLLSIALRCQKILLSEMRNTKCIKFSSSKGVNFTQQIYWTLFELWLNILLNPLYFSIAAFLHETGTLARKNVGWVLIFFITGCEKWSLYDRIREEAVSWRGKLF